MITIPRSTPGAKIQQSNDECSKDTSKSSKGIVSHKQTVRVQLIRMVHTEIGRSRQAEHLGLDTAVYMLLSRAMLSGRPAAEGLLRAVMVVFGPMNP